MNITIRPLGRGRFAASVCRCPLCESKTPLFTAARIFQAEGIPDDTPITMTHEGSGIVSMRSTVGEAASRIVEETDKKGPRFKRYRPMSSEMPRQRVREQSKTAMDEPEVGRAKDEPEQLSLWDLPPLDEASDPRVRLRAQKPEKMRELPDVDCDPDQLSFFVPHLLGDYA